MHSFRRLIPFVNHYYDYMKYSIICLKKFSGTLKFSVLQLKLIFNSQQNFNMMISAAELLIHVYFYYRRKLLWT